MSALDGINDGIGRRLWLTLALLIALFVGGNGLVILQFERACMETDRLTGVSQKLIGVLRLQETLLSFHQRMNELANAKDLERLITEGNALRATLREQTKQTRNTLAYLPAELREGPAFLTALNTIEVTLPIQLDDVTALATAGDWAAVRLRLDNELNRIETTTSALVKSIDRDLDEELPIVVANMRDVQRRILFIVPATAISTVLIAAFLGWAIARRILELRLEARVHERTQIARDLHDTLLQSFLGVVMKFETVGFLIPDRQAEAQSMLTTACGQAREAIDDARRAVQGLREPAVTPNDLALVIGAMGEELASGQDAAQPPEFRVQLAGTPRDLVPLVRTEIYWIAREALRNAFKHAHAKQISVVIDYNKQGLRLRIEDDGAGIDPEVLREGAAAGHYGLLGLRERARLIGAKLAIRSEFREGTEIELSVPGSAAYVKPGHGRA